MDRVSGWCCQMMYVTYVDVPSSRCTKHNDDRKIHHRSPLTRNPWISIAIDQAEHGIVKCQHHGSINKMTQFSSTEKTTFRKINQSPSYISGWWFQPTPLKNDGLRQLGSWHSAHSQYHGKVIIHSMVAVTTKQIWSTPGGGGLSLSWPNSSNSLKVFLALPASDSRDIFYSSGADGKSWGFFKEDIQIDISDIYSL